MSGLVEVRGTGSSGDDFREYRLSVGLGEGAGAGAGGWQLLRRSSQPANAATVGEWNTTAATEGATYTLRLEAEDLAGNVAEARVAVTVDNLAPAAPSGLVAVLAGARDVNLAWAANAETDLAGYLLYRGNRLVNAPGPVVGSLAPYLLAATSYHDAAVPDGAHDYTVLAMDRAGNLSPPSAPAHVELDEHAPHAMMVSPADGARFEAALYVVATVADSDVRDVRFEWRTAGAGGWTAIGTADASAPYEALFDPAAFAPALEHGDYELRAVATDLGERVDLAPTAVHVTYTDLTAPMAPAGLTLQIDGGDAHLAWAASEAEDLAGYDVYRRSGDGTETRLTAAAIVTTSYVDSGLADGDYTYWVTAVDEDDNASSPSAERSGRVYAATLEQPFSPVLAASTSLAGTGAADAHAMGTVATDGGTSTLPDAPTDGDGNFSYSALPLTTGDNRFTVRAIDADGNRSKPASVRVVRGVRPAPPTALAATVDDHEGTITWQPSATPGVIGYLVYDEGHSLIAPVPVTPLTATASRDDSYAPASAAVDGDLDTYWGNPDEGSRGDWLEVGLGGQHLVTGVAGNLMAEQGLALQGWDGEAWITLATHVTPPYPVDVQIDLPRPYRTDRLRLLILGDAPWIGVWELQVRERPLVAGASFNTHFDWDGVHPITVTAWSDLGFESNPAPLAVPVGDATPPDPVTLSATVEGSRVHLAWTASTAADLEQYDVYRDGARIFEHLDLADRTYVDARPNGTYRYFVTAVDHAYNSSAHSNEVEVTVADSTPLSAPTITFPAGPGEVATAA
ncbi:MAG TPA: discoidin domain-containing protein, partial [Thermoanaerobaculia bacterium]|nr:discoidin domain-containing protein [Thermoanaerobaculia bacterium]